MRILALDLGTTTGFAAGYKDTPFIECGTWKLATAKEIAGASKNRLSRRLDPRIPTLWNRLTDWHLGAKIDWLVFEDVQFSSTTMQTQLWASFRTVVWLFAAINRIQVECLGVIPLKKFGAGHGGATKDMMAKSLARNLPDEFAVDTAGRLHYFAHSEDEFLDDNACDAVHLLLWAKKTLKNA